MTESARGFVVGPAHAHFVLALLVAGGGAWFYQSNQVAALKQALDDKALSKEARNRSDDVQNGRIDKVEAWILANCKH